MEPAQGPAEEISHLFSELAVTHKNEDDFKPDHIDQFFACYPDFNYNRKKSSPQEFNRMLRFLSWKHNKKSNAEQNQKNSAEQEQIEAYENFRIATINGFNSWFGTDPDDICSWQGICEMLKMHPIPPAMEDMREAVVRSHVNLWDLLDNKRNGMKFHIFATEKALAGYTERTRKIFPKGDAYEGGLLKYLLGQIRGKYHGRRGKAYRAELASRMQD